MNNVCTKCNVDRSVLSKLLEGTEKDQNTALKAILVCKDC